ncbi:hypothetical protein [Agriterribacter sp.]|uniref:hypothetical protein n=1 Tax=Agriterribacter sp. TaxID=2821509 RepID=UPI002C512C3A|nr:hypothetical protein [Agriterribacter sp.]HTN05949.1 hypothetical protein [Agriterribacter sp.]
MPLFIRGSSFFCVVAKGIFSKEKKLLILMNIDSLPGNSDALVRCAMNLKTISISSLKCCTKDGGSSSAIGMQVVNDLKVLYSKDMVLSV